MTDIVVASKTNTSLAPSGTVFSDNEVFVSAQRMAQALASSTIVPKDYQGSVANCLIALEMATRCKTSPLVVMQNMVVIHGRPSWSSSFLIAMVNTSGKFTSMRFTFDGEGDEWGCRASATDLVTGDHLVGPFVSISMAKNEGWFGRQGSKWKTMAETMLMYRAAAFWIRVHAPEFTHGMHTDDELRDFAQPAQQTSAADVLGA
ncbi:MAG: hypothetical protein ACRC4O_03435 [Giesbergeria sp.]